MWFHTLTASLHSESVSLHLGMLGIGMHGLLDYMAHIWEVVSFGFSSQLGDVLGREWKSLNPVA